MIRTVKHLRSKPGFADLYLDRYAIRSIAIQPEPDPDVFLIVIIPAFRELNVCASVKSLLACDPPGIKWEILVNVNYPENSDEQTIRDCHQSYQDLLTLSGSNERSDVRILCLLSPDVPQKSAGVGRARKTAMDEAVSRFNRIGRPDGVIVSFDADCACERNYVSSIAGMFFHRSNIRTANIFFEHPLEGDLDVWNYNSITQYELYLRYMRQAIRNIGHPHAIHTVGSSFCVRCKTYLQVNGMGTHKAGEDFYFLHKCIRLGGFWEINDTAVNPSPRISDRVIFGTGASIGKMQGMNELMVFNPESFEPLRTFLSYSSAFWDDEIDERIQDSFISEFHPALADFLNSRDAWKAIARMKKNSSGRASFQKKFFEWFNGFMILTYLNSAHKNFYSKVPVLEAAGQLADTLGLNPGGSARDLLLRLRKFERQLGNTRII